MGVRQYYGIDLGTTNSLIGSYEGGEFRLFQNRDRMNATPSAVYVRSPEQKLVGLRALDLIRNDPGNGKIEFKRNMGRDDQFFFPRANIQLTATELAAEILNSLCSDVIRLRQGNEVESAVITVPASFGVAACRATADAAKLAGIEDVLLLQEPVAAAIAYGVQPGSENQNWLVFDLGGGTFDVAVVSTRDSNLTTVSHAGDRFLGGKDIDRNLTENFFIPHLEREGYRIPFPTGDDYKTLFAKLLRKAEDVKVALSYEQEYLVDLDDLGSDQAGKSINTELKISQRQLEQCAEQMIERCLVLSKRALAEARISPAEVTKVLLVGGATQMPYVRRKIKETLGITVEFERDPITAIVEGAAFFGLTRKAARPAGVSDGKASLEIITDVDVVPGEARAHILGRVFGAEQPLEIGAFSKSTGWKSEWQALREDGSFEIEVALDDEARAQVFELKLRAKLGIAMELKGNQVTINRAITVGAPKLQHSLWIEVQGRDGSSFDSLFDKGTFLPVEKRDLKYRLARNLTHGAAEEFLPIKIWEGEDPQCLELVGVVEIKKGPGILIAGHVVELNISLDESRILHASTFLPEKQMMVNLAVALPDDMAVHQRRRLLETKLSENYHLIERIKPLVVLKTEIGKEFERIIKEMENISIRLYHSSDNPEEVDRLASREQEVGVALKSLADKLLLGIQGPESTYAADKRVALAQLGKIKGRTGDARLEEEVTRLESEISNTDQFDRNLGLKLQHAANLYLQVLIRDVSLLKEHFDFAKSRQIDMSNQEAAGKYIMQGENALQKNDARALYNTIRQLYMLLPEHRAEVREKKDLIPGITQY